MKRRKKSFLVRQKRKPKKISSKWSTFKKGNNRVGKMSWQAT